MTDMTAADMTIRRYRETMRLIGEDETAIKLFDDLIEACARYFSKVVLMESRLLTARSRLSGDELKALTQELDQGRSLAHEALISNLHIFNRFIISKYAVQLQAAGMTGGIFPNPEAIRDRVAIANWAWALLWCIYHERRR